MTAAILLAAGASTRMGEQKLLLPWDGKVLVRAVADTLAEAALSPIVAVTGYDHGQVSAALADAPVDIVRNPDPDAGMLGSVRCGIRALPREVDRVVVALGDHPGISTDTVARLAAHPCPTPSIIVPVHNGRRGHPVAIDAPFLPEILAWFDTVGLRGLLRAHPRAVCEIPVDDPGVLLDIDTPSDYRQGPSVGS